MGVRSRYRSWRTKLKAAALAPRVQDRTVNAELLLQSRRLTTVLTHPEPPRSSFRSQVKDNHFSWRGSLQAPLNHQRAAETPVGSMGLPIALPVRFRLTKREAPSRLLCHITFHTSPLHLKTEPVLDCGSRKRNSSVTVFGFHARLR